MKILLVLDNLSVDSGVSSIVVNLYRGMTNLQIDFLIYSQKQSAYMAEVRRNGDQVYILDKILSPKTNLKGMIQTRRFFRQHAKDYDAVYLHSPTLNEFTLRHAKRNGIPHRVIHSHSSMTSPNPVKKVLNRLLTRNVTRYANHYWTCSDKAAAFLYGEDFVKTHPVEMVYNGVLPEAYLFDKQSREEMRDQLGLTNKMVFCHVSNFSPIKNLPFLIPVIAQVTRLNSDVCFLFVGDGPAKEEFETMLREAGLQDVCLFVGRQANVLPYLQVADGLLLPSLKEGLPVTVIEAQANGLPCFITDTITRQCDVGDVIFLPLKPEAWVAALTGFRAYAEAEREKRSCDFQKSPFNIHTEAKRVEELFLRMMGGDQ